MIYGYARVSTCNQDYQGQIEALENEGCQIIYKEKFTGTSTDRPQLNELLNLLEEGDTLVVTKLDRIARSATQGSDLVKELLEKGVRVNILNMGMMDNRPTSKLIRTIFFAFAEFERDMIVERTQEGKAIARQNPDFKEGRPVKHKQPAIEHALQLLETRTYKQVEEITGISKSTLIRAKRKQQAQDQQ